jgi:hypothetical protein
MSNPDSGAGGGKPSISTDISSRGATIRTAYVEREVTAYAIFENEVRTISMWNTLAGVFTSIGAATLSFAIGIWTSAAFTDKLPPEGNILSHVVAPVFCFATIVCWAIAIWAVVSRSKTWAAIRTESKQPDQPTR